MKRFLFLQGPISPFFDRLAEALRAHGHAAHRINLCLGDRLAWRGPGAVDFRGPLADWPGFLADFLDAHRITDLVLLGEQRVYHRVAIAAAEARGIAVTATDFGYIRPGWIILEREGHNARSRFPRDRAAILALADAAPPFRQHPPFPSAFGRQALWDWVWHMSSLLPWPFPHFESHQLHHPVPGYFGTGWRLLRRGAEDRRARRLLASLPEDRAFFLFCMQMETDFSLRAYSTFPDLETPMRLAMEAFARHAPPDAVMAFKVHPLDPGLRNWRRMIDRLAEAAGVAGRAHYLDAYALDPYVLRAAGVVTVNSTAALRAIELGRPVLALGEAIYRIPGLAHMGPPERFWTTPERPDGELAVAFVRAIAHHLHVRGGFYGEEELEVAVAEAAERLASGQVGPPLLPPSPPPEPLPEPASA